MTTDTLNKVQDAERINDKRKAELLRKQVEHIDIKSFDARPIVEAMGKMSFTSRDLARATGIYNQMLADPDCSIFLVVAGSLMGFTIYMRLLRDWGAFRAGLYAFISPAVAVGAGVFALGEPFGPAEAIGSLLMFGAAAIALKR